ncbi:hypothetical protein L2E82_43545 [Cichorium intybus]|uniref:Uncharacterized protein n=1 Tax=Cichorium intybus TaxID=13427 RepID=A0ACB8ZNT7_CICIN|nr:hypothetical protein L2E82_43545 [Cichorium intybus]
MEKYLRNDIFDLMKSGYVSEVFQTVISVSALILVILMWTNKECDSYIVEWNESDGAIKGTYNGLGKRSVEVVHFDTTKNRFLADLEVKMELYQNIRRCILHMFCSF